MPTSLARRIRRIGLLPTTYKKVTFPTPVKQEDGTVLVKDVERSVPVRHSEPLTPEQREHAAKMLTQEYRNLRKTRQATTVINLSSKKPLFTRPTPQPPTKKAKNGK